jgi:hypothetical protein
MLPFDREKQGCPLPRERPGRACSKLITSSSIYEFVK